jgi:hypothetical protein
VNAAERKKTARSEIPVVFIHANPASCTHTSGLNTTFL